MVSRDWLMLLPALLALSCFFSAQAKMVEVRQNILMMDKRDRIVGHYEHVFLRDETSQATPPPLPGRHTQSLLPSSQS